MSSLRSNKRTARTIRSRRPANQLRTTQSVQLPRLTQPNAKDSTGMIVTGKAGQGTYGVVYIVEKAEDGTALVVKRNIIDAETDFSGSIKELDLLNRLSGHPYIVKLVSVSFENPFQEPLSPIRDPELKEDYLHFVFEKANFDGHNLIYKTIAPYRMLKNIMVQMLLALEYMHGKGIVHRDIKPSNLLWFDKEKCIKICDFGLSKYSTRQGTNTPRVVTSWYRAPEICLFWPDYNEKVDIWSVGCIFYEMIAKKAFLHGAADKEVALLQKISSSLPTGLSTATTKKMLKYINKDYVNEFKDSLQAKGKPATFEASIGLSRSEVDNFDGSGPGTYRQFIDLLEHLLSFDPDNRYSATQALEHAFFDGYRNIIRDCRKNHPPVAAIPEPVNIYAGKERQLASSICFTIFNNRNQYRWYRHRILFSAIDIFDRYLDYLTKVKKTVQSLDQYQIELRFMVCLYVAIKFFTTMHTPSSFKALVLPEYATDEALKDAEKFEIELIRDVLKLRIYRETVYEVADSFNQILTDEEVRDLLMFYGLLESTSGLPPRELYKFFSIKMGRPTSPVRLRLPERKDVKRVPTLSQHNKLARPNGVLTCTIDPKNNPQCRLKIINRVDYYKKTDSPPAQALTNAV